MSKLWNWLGKEPFGKDVIFVILFLVMIGLAYVYGACNILAFLKIELPVSSLIPISLDIFFFSRLCAWAFLEEIIFRLGPLSILVVITQKFLWKPLPIVLGVVMVFSIIFGWAHGNCFNVFVQGVGGLILSFVYLKCGGLRGDWAKGTFSSTVVHFLYNSLLTISYLLAGYKAF